jgi:hypothetical protein
MCGIYKFLSFLAIYYVFVSLVDIYGTIKSYRSKTQNPDIAAENKGLKFDFSTDLVAVCVIYLVSYYSGVLS